MYFLFNFDWYSIQLDIFSQEKVGWGGGGYVNRQNPLNMTKVIKAQQSLQWFIHKFLDFEGALKFFCFLIFMHIIPTNYLSNIIIVNIS